MSIISKIYLKGLWLKKTYSFNWAHKPLCERYKEDVLQIKHINLCRSCFFVYLGMMMSFILSIVFRDFHIEYGNMVLCGLLSLTLPLSYPTLYKKFPRILRDTLRYSIGYIIIQTFFRLLYGHFILAFVASSLIYIFGKMYFTQRAKRKIQQCHTCEEYSENTVCSGYQKQRFLIREYEEEATEYILSTGYVPKIPK